MNKISKKSSVTFVELPPTQFGILNGDASYDVYTKFRLPSRANHVLESILRRDGWENVVSINPIYHGENKRLSEENFKRIYFSDLLLLSSITRTAIQTIELARNYKSKNPNGIAIAGGSDPTFRTEEWLRYVDIVVKGEGEKTLSELMERLTKDRENIDDINGIAFRKGSEIKITKPRSLLTSDELSSIPHPYYDLETKRGVTTAVIETSRGCPNDCDFCSVSEFYGRKYRTKSIDYIVEGLNQITDMGIPLFFIDDNLVGNAKHSINLLKAIVDSGLNNRAGLAQVTIKVAENPEVLKALKKARIDTLCVGIESLNNETLNDLGKPYSAEQNKKAVTILKKEKFWVHGMLMLGGDGDTSESLKETSEWINENLDSVQLFALTPLPGTRFYKRMEEQGKILTKDFSLYDAQHVVIRPKNFNPYELQKIIYKMYEKFYCIKDSVKRLIKSSYKRVSLELMIYTNFLNGVKNTLYDPQSRKHLEFLKSVSYK